MPNAEYKCTSRLFFFANNVGLYINSQPTINMGVDIHVAYIVCLDHNDLAFFVNVIWQYYVRFGSERRKLVGNSDRRLDVVTLQRAAGREF